MSNEHKSAFFQVQKRRIETVGEAFDRFARQLAGPEMVEHVASMLESENSPSRYQDVAKYLWWMFSPLCEVEEGISFRQCGGAINTGQLYSRVRNRIKSDHTFNSMKSLDTIMDLVAAEFGVTKENLLGRDRHRNMADAKQAMVMVARDTGWTVMGLGSQIGRHYSAVVKSRQFAADKYDIDPKFRIKVDRIKSAL